MIYWLNDLLSEGSEVFINLFRYITFRAGLATMIAFGASVLFGPWVIRKLISLKIGQPVRTAEEVHKLAELHGEKAGTPTMGGVLILSAVAGAAMLCARLDNPMVWTVLFVAIGLGFLGFLDDYKKVTRKNSQGISARFKLVGQVAIATGAGLFLFLNPETSAYISKLHVPFSKTPVVDMGFFCIPFFIVVIVGCSNAVNLTDGLDGLAIGCTITVAITYALFCYLTGNLTLGKEYLLLPYNKFSGELTIICMALVGAGLGFLWFNCHPAKVFMGDTGSLAIGGLLGTVAICSKHELVLVVVGGVFVMEAASVILQVGSFKLRKKRIFRMAPIHHHFELKGWHENQVIIRFWTLSVILALLGLATLKLR